MNLSDASGTAAPRCIPRVSGGEPDVDTVVSDDISYSPRERG